MARDRGRARGAGLKTALAALLLLAAAAGAQAAERIVSIGGAVTEIVYALGAEGRLVAVDSTSTWPPEAGKLPNVGYMRRLSAEPIVGMAPDMVIAVEGSGPDSALAQLREAGVRVETVPEAYDAAGVAAKVERVAALLGRQAEGAKLAETVRSRMAAVERQVAATTERPRVLFLMSASRGAPMAAGRHTAADAVIRLAGGVNVVDGYDGYKALSPEATVAAAPDFVLAMSETVESMGGTDKILALPELSAKPRTQVVAMPGQLLLGFGPRTPDAVQALADALHPAPAAKP